VKDSTKTEDGSRSIPLAADTLTELRAIQREQRERRVGLGEGWQGAKSPATTTLRDAHGAMLEPNTFAYRFRTLAEQNKMTHVTPHILRHALVSQMIALGYDAVTISSMTGHSPDVLLRTYAHAFDKGRTEAVDALGEARRVALAAK